MKTIVKVGIVTGVYETFIFVNFLSKKAQALKLARSLSAGKGIINIGAGCSRTGFSKSVCELSEVIFNVDLNDNCDKCVVADLEAPLPFTDKQFDVAFASHVLEHLNHWEQALNEWTRIADNVIIVLPNPLSINGYLCIEHKQHFSFNDINYIRSKGARVYA